MGILTPLVATRNLSIKCGWTTCLQDVTFNLFPGELCALIGPSGSGKSVLFESLMGFHKTTNGSLSNHQNTTGLVPQKDELHDNLSPKEALEIAAALRSISKSKKNQVQSILQQVDLTDHQHKSIRQLSGGQRKRVSIALELLSSSTLLLLDEPCASLDPLLEKQQMELFLNLADQGRGILLSTHRTYNLDNCHCLLVMYQGCSVFFGTPSQAKTYFRVNVLSEIYEQLDKMQTSSWLSRYKQFERSEQFLKRFHSSKIKHIPSKVLEEAHVNA